MPGIFGPIGCIRHLRPKRAQHRLHIRRQRFQLRHGGINPRRAAQLRQPNQFRADQKGVHPAGQLGQLRVMQHHAAQAEIVFGAFISQAIVLQLEIIDLRRAEKRRDLRLGRWRQIGRARQARRDRAGNPPPPGIIGLSAATIGIGQALFGANIHENERI